MSDSYSNTSDPAGNPGPFLFAWVDSSETTFNESHHRVDEDVIAWRIEHSEGDFATLEITIRNPRIGLLAPSRPVWAWFAFNRSWQPDAPVQETSSDSEAFPSEPPSDASESPDVVPLIFGRLVGVPDDLQAELVTLHFIARPEDFATQKETVAASKRVAPYWDGIWFAPENRYDPDNILESRPELWHIDRVTHVVSTSNIVNGEDGTETLGEDAIFYDSLSVSYGEAPLRRIDVVADVSWNQQALGALDFSEYCAFGSGHSILTFTGDGLEKNWPKTGAKFAGGWYVAFGAAERIDGIGGAIWGYGLRNVKGASAGAAGNPFGRSYMATDEFHDVIVPSWATAQTVLSNNFPARILGIPRWRIKPTLVLGYEADRKKSEKISFSLEADVQAVLTEPGDEETLLLTFASSEIASPVDPVEGVSSDEDVAPFALPLGSVSNRSYFTTPRGTQSVEYLIALARSRLLARSRCVSVAFEIPFETGIGLGLSCRKNIVIEDGRLPGGIAGGKITSYTLSGDGDTGALACAITIGCTVGKGNTVTTIEGDPTYVEEGYVDRPYQFYENEFVMPIAGEVVYQTIEGLEPDDDGLDFNSLTPAHVFVSMVKTGTHTAQKTAMGTSAEEPQEVFQKLNQVPTEFTLTLKPVSGQEFATYWPIPMSQLMVPKTIDLEAESST